MEVILHLKSSQEGQPETICEIALAQILNPSEKICTCCKKQKGSEVTYSLLKTDTRFNPYWIEETVIKNRVIGLLNKIYKDIVTCENHVCKVRASNTAMIAFSRKGHQVVSI